jgi:hypothetical protein
MAAITSAVVGIGAGLYSANQQKKSAQGATNAQVQSQEAAIAEQRRQYDLSRADQMPWLNAGKGALGQMQTLNSGDYSSFNASPDYQWTLSEGMKGLDRSAASKGRLYSGGYGEDLTRYAQGAASTQYNNYYNKLADMAGVGSTTATQLGGLGQNYANQFGNAQSNMGNARASGYVNQANTNSSLAGGIANSFADWYGGQNTSLNGGWYLGKQPGKG